MLTSQSITPTRSCFWCAHQMRVKLNDLGRRLPRWRKAFSQRGRRCSRIGRMLASADNAEALHPVDCAPGPRRPVAQRLDHSHPSSVVLQREVRPAQAHAAGSGVVPSRAGSYVHPYAWECGQRPFRGVAASLPDTYLSKRVIEEKRSSLGQGGEEENTRSSQQTEQQKLLGGRPQWIHLVYSGRTGMSN